MDEYCPWVVTHDDDSQTLVSIFLEDGQVAAVQLAHRPDKWSSWGVPDFGVKG